MTQPRETTAQATIRKLKLNNITPDFHKLEMKGTLIGLSKVWIRGKMSNLQLTRDGLRKTVRRSIKRINHDLETRYNNTMKSITKVCCSMSTDESPLPNGVNLFAAHEYPDTRNRLLDAPKLSLDETVLPTRQHEAEGKEKQEEHRAQLFNGSNIRNRRRVSPYMFSEVSIESGVETDLNSPKPRSAISKEILSSLAELAEETHLRMKETHERKRQEYIRMEEERRFSVRKAYDDRYKLIPPKQELSGPSNEGLNKVSSKEEGERRRKNWRANIPRTKDGKMIAYGCGDRFDWEKEWEKKKTPAVCGKKRKRLYTFDSYLEERRPVRRRTGLTSRVFVHEPRSTAFPALDFNLYD